MSNQPTQSDRLDRLKEIIRISHKLRGRIDEIRLLDHRGFMPLGNNEFKYDAYQSDLDKRISNLTNQLNQLKGDS